MSKQGPDGSCVPVRQGDGSNIRVSSVEQMVQPGIRLGMTGCRQNRGPCAVDQQGPQVHVSALADAQQGWLGRYPTYTSLCTNSLRFVARHF